MNNTIPPHGVRTHADRTIEAHVIRGLSYWLAQGRGEFHPLEFAYSVNAQVNCNFWSGYNNPWKGDSSTTEVLFQTIGMWWSGDTLDLVQNFNSLYGAVSCLPHGRQHAVLTKLQHYKLHVHVPYSDVLPTSERLNAMATEDVRQLPPDVISRLDHSLAALQAALDNKDPMMAAHLQNSHSLIQSYPEAVHLLTDDKIKLLIGAAQQHTKTEIIAKAVAGKGAATKRAKIGVGDL